MVRDGVQQHGISHLRMVIFRPGYCRSTSEPQSVILAFHGSLIIWWEPYRLHLPGMRRDMPNLPVFSESAFPYFALAFGVIGFAALKVWGRILDYKHDHPKASGFTQGKRRAHRGL